MQFLDRKPKKVRASKGDAITTIAQIHNSGLESDGEDKICRSTHVQTLALFCLNF